MATITPIALTVTGEEKAIALVETNMMAPDSSGMRRYQIIYVIRDDKMAEFRRDMGPSKKWKGVNLLNIPSLMEHTVDELLDIADEIRGQSKIDVKDFLELENYKPA